MVVVELTVFNTRERRFLLWGQQNAASAEESASASEEMSAQAEQMKGMVSELVALVGGGSHRVKGDRSAVNHGVKPTIDKSHTLADPAKMAQSSVKEFHQTKEVGPKHLIPLGDEDFKDF